MWPGYEVRNKAKVSHRALHTRCEVCERERELQTMPSVQGKVGLPSL